MQYVGGGPESQTNTWNFVRKIAHFFKQTKCSKQPKKQNKPNFYFPQTCAMGGWGTMFGTKSQKKTFFFTPSLSIVLNFAFCCEHYYGQNSVRKLLKKLNKAFCFQRDPRMFWMCVCCWLVCSLRFSFLPERHGGQIQTKETSKAVGTCIQMQSRHRQSQWRPEWTIS